MRQLHFLTELMAQTVIKLINSIGTLMMMNGNLIHITGCSPPAEDVDVNRFDESRLTVDRHCYECKVKYRDPTAKDLVMFLHAWTYSVSMWDITSYHTVSLLRGHFEVNCPEREGSKNP